MKSGTKIFLAIFLVLAITGIVIAFYLYNLKPRDMNSVKSDYILSSGELLKEFEDNEVAAGKKYINKVVEVSGEIASINAGENNSLNVSLKTDSNISSVICTFASGDDLEGYKSGQEISIRGECSGYLMDVLINRCRVVKE